MKNVGEFTITGGAIEKQTVRDFHKKLQLISDDFNKLLGDFAIVKPDKLMNIGFMDNGKFQILINYTNWPVASK
jgi:hypothetical protein